jgi:peptide/nickel transport system ATP-binding protein
VAACHLLADSNHQRGVSETVSEDRIQKDEPSETLLEVKDLKTHFPVKRGLLQRTVAHVRAVDGVSFQLRRGETVALVGESGCGKTTVGQSILRLTSEARGTVNFEGTDVLSVGKATLKAQRKRMQIIFQDPFASLSPRMRVRQIIEEGLMIHNPGLSQEAREKKLFEVMDQVRLPKGVVDRFPHEFSGGQRQRIAIARALILDPELLILDEPTSALDVSVQAQVLNLLEDIQRERLLAYLFITHDLGVVEYLADWVAVMYLGRIVEYAPTSEIFRSAKHPYTRALLEAVPRIDAPLRPFNLIEGDVPSPLNPPAGCHFHPRCPLATELCRNHYPGTRTFGETRAACHHVDGETNAQTSSA